jgi:hypothetical protein
MTPPLVYPPLFPPAGGGGVCDQNAANNSKARSGAPGPNRHFSCSHDLSRSAEL